MTNSGDGSGNSGGVSAGRTRPSLLNGLRAKDPDAWQRLARLYAPLVHTWCRRRGLEQADAEDVVQEVFHAVMRGMADFRRDRPNDSFYRWLRGITRHKLIDHFRRQANQSNALGGSDAQEQFAQLPADEPLEDDAPEYSGLLRRAIELIRSEFEDSSCQAFLQYKVEGRGADVVAKELGLSVNAVYTASSRILRRLREVLGEVADE
jgi:RNA polymerase sigma-70 factor (ECF subfamily)